jgi:DNA topoisomerase IA
MAKKKTNADAGQALVIVESPAKARTIGKFLGKGYRVEASIGHVRDLPQGAKQVPAQFKGQPWANLGVNVDNGFEPIYIVPALAGPRDVDQGLVRAQETRRIIDRLYGYEVSPLLWRKVRPKLSAGRVQSVAVRLIVARERERMAFVSAMWWDLLASFAKQSGESLEATLISVDGRKIPVGKDFDSSTGKLANLDAILLDEATARSLADRIRNGEFRVAAVEDKPYTSRPYAPFTTSTPAGRCRWPRVCTRTATSPTCGLTRQTWPPWRSKTPGRWWSGTTAASTCPSSRAFTSRRSRTHRRPTRRSDPQGIRSSCRT